MIERILKEIYYAFRLPCFIRNYKIDYSLGDLIVKLLNENNFVIEYKYGSIMFVMNSFTIEAWNLNKYYAWLSDGVIKSKGGKELKQWRGISISRYHMYKINKMIEQYKKNRNNEIYNIISSL